MSGCLNKCQFIGYLGKDPEIRRTQDGRPIANLSLGCTESWRDKQSGDRRERTEWVRVVIFNEGLAGVVDKYCHKGDRLYIEGQLQTRKWQDQHGNDRYSTEVVLQNFAGQLVMLSSKGESEERQRATERADANTAERAGVGEKQYGDHRGDGPSNGASDFSSNAGGGHKPRHDMDDEIPF
jgi:single-strand DNA-binding protein